MVPFPTKSSSASTPGKPHTPVTKETIDDRLKAEINQNEKEADEGEESDEMVPNKIIMETDDDLKAKEMRLERQL